MFKTTCQKFFFLILTRSNRSYEQIQSFINSAQSSVKTQIVLLLVLAANKHSNIHSNIHSESSDHPLLNRDHFAITQSASTSHDFCLFFQSVELQRCSRWPLVLRLCVHVWSVAEQRCSKEVCFWSELFFSLQHCSGVAGGPQF